MKLTSTFLTLALLTSAPAAYAGPIYAITVPNTAGANLVSFDSTTPTPISTIGAITGIVAGHSLRGIDFRPSNGMLYAVSSSGSAAQLYTIDLLTGAATAVGAGFTMTDNTSVRVSLDFNPVADALRVVTGSGQSYRVNANTGALIAQDTDISGTPLIAGIAYSNNFFGATQTTLYGYDFIDDVLGTIGGLNGVPSPNTGAFNLIGSSGVITADAGLGFDIGADGVAYISVDDLSGSPGSNAELFTVNLATGAFTQLSLDEFAGILDISVLPTAVEAVPEPGTVSLFALGTVALLAARRRKR